MSEDAKVIIEAPKADIRSFTVTLSQPAGMKRGQGKGSFVSSVTSLVDQFYTDVVQPLKPWAPRAPRPKTASGRQPTAALGVADGAEAAPRSPVSVVESLDHGAEPVLVAGLRPPGSS